VTTSHHAGLFAYDVSVAASPHAALSSFGARLTVGPVLSTCSPIDFELGVGGSFGTELYDVGEPLCACEGQTKDCVVEAAHALPPLPSPGLNP
jgi:hypothetical protein